MEEEGLGELRFTGYRVPPDLQNIPGRLQKHGIYSVFVIFH